MAPSPPRCPLAIAVLAGLGMAKPGPAEWSAHPHFLGSQEGPVAGYLCDCEAVRPLPVLCAWRGPRSQCWVCEWEAGRVPALRGHPSCDCREGPVAGTQSRTLIYLLLITRASDGFCYFQDVFSISF